MEILVRTYGLKNYIRYFNHNDIVRDWTMLGAAWKWHGEKKITVNSVTAKDPLNDESVVRELYEVLDKADILIGHNSDRFDLKKFNTRALHYGLPPLHIETKQTVDTLKIAKKYFALTSNTLAYIARFLGVSSKDESPDWRKVINGDAKEIKYMRKYNKQDVLVTEKVYDILKGYDMRHPKINLIANIRDSDGRLVSLCQTCLSPELHSRGHVFLASGKKKPRWVCQDCGANSYGKAE